MKSCLEGSSAHALSEETERQPATTRLPQTSLDSLPVLYHLCNPLPDTPALASSASPHIESGNFLYLSKGFLE